MNSNVDSWVYYTGLKNALATWYIRVYTDEQRNIQTSTLLSFTDWSEWRETLNTYLPTNG